MLLIPSFTHLIYPTRSRDDSHSPGELANRVIFAARHSISTTRPVAPWRVKSNRTSSRREPVVSIGGNVHFLAASIANRSKYRLGPGSSTRAAKTLPSLSTINRTATRTCPRMLSRIRGGMSGISS